MQTNGGKKKTSETQSSSQWRQHRQHRQQVWHVATCHSGSGREEKSTQTQLVFDHRGLPYERPVPAEHAVTERTLSGKRAVLLLTQIKITAGRRK